MQEILTNGIEMCVNNMISQKQCIGTALSDWARGKKPFLINFLYRQHINKEFITYNYNLYGNIGLIWVIWLLKSISI